MSDAPGTAVEQYREPSAPAVLGEREMKSIEFQARTIAVLDSRLKNFEPEIRKEKAVGLAITLYNYGLPITATNAKKLHLIGNGDDAEIMESAQLLVGLLEARGHEVRVVEDSDERAVVRGWRHGAGQPHEVIYTIEQAERSGALDEWVEEWKKDNGGKWQLEQRLQIVRDEDTGHYRPKDPTLDMPGWATQQIRRGRVKRMDAWHKYRSDMLVNRAVRRLAKRMGGDALLGVGVLEEDEPSERVSPPAPPRPVVEDEGHDDDIEDAELVEEEPDGSGSAPSDEETKQEPTPVFHPCCGHPIDGPHDVDCKGQQTEESGTLDLEAPTG